MVDKPAGGGTKTATATATTKRRSLLGELGIKPGGPGTTASKPANAPLKRAHTVTGTAAARSTATGSTAKSGTTRPRPLSLVAGSPSAAVPASPKRSTSSLSRTSNSSTGSATSKPGRKKTTTPAAISTTGSATRSPATASPTTPTPLPKRRSVVPTTSAQRQQPSSPLVRRSSVVVSSTATVTKRKSSPAGLESLQEVKALKDKLAQKEEMFEKQETKLKELQSTVDRLEKERLERQTEPETPLLSSSSHLIPCELSVDSESLEEAKVKSMGQKEVLRMEKPQNESTYAKNEPERGLVTEEVTRKLREEIKEEMKEELVRLQQVMDEKEKQWDASRSQQDQERNKLVVDHEQELSQLRGVYEEKAKEAAELASLEKTEITARMTEEHKAECSKLEKRVKELEEILDESRDAAHIRKLESQLSSAHALFEEHKRQAEQATENLERRFRDEIQQLQNGSDDTAQVWVEKNRATQQEIDRLHDTVRQLEEAHQKSLSEAENTYAESLDEWKEKCEGLEAEIDGQAQENTSLAFQIETLQNSLEAATARLETHTSNLSKTKEGSGRSSEESHRMCEERLQARQQELQNRISELKETHEAQLNRLGNEKARELQDLRRELEAVKEQGKSNTTLNEERLRSIVQQHKQEVAVMYQQYQDLVDKKDLELEDYAYRVKALSTSKQKEMEQLRIESVEKIEKCEQEIEGYEKRIQDYNETIQGWENHKQANDSIMEQLKRDFTASRDENEQLSRLLHQLQSEIHK
ncbi:hypothetical protein DFQ28_002649 [Apophysomyces sp. BC1034]|nr:hypothetical protein DFQ29_001828 [Apophysomyces sp. BC1021]KAG0189983.1 hypothetical protein DFQ28_002649 [Apophysomyces sp. BC1034]